MCGSNMHSVAVSNEIRHGRPEVFADKCWVKYCTVSQRYGVISLVNSPPSTNNIAHALSSIFKHKLNQMGSNRTNIWNSECFGIISKFSLRIVSAWA